MIALWIAGCSVLPGGGEAPAPTVEDARAFLATLPPYLRPADPTPVPEGLPDLSAETCGACHPDFLAEWRLSTHAQAWLGDPQFQAELQKSIQPDSDVGWMCVNCHTPMEGQLPRLVAGFRDGRLDQPIYVENPSFNEAFQREAITCAACHVREGRVLGPHGDTDAPHATRRSDLLRSADLCGRCHQARAEFPELSLACTFDTVEELARGPYAGSKVCQDCHMPVVERPLVPGGPVRRTRRHWFGGSLIPKTPEVAQALAPMQAAFPHGLELDWAERPEHLVAGAEARLVLRATNAHAGHLLPTGDPERFVTVTVRATGPDGAELGVATLRLGTRYQWWPEVRKLEDTRLPPREHRDLVLAFTAPGEGPVTVRVEAVKARISDENVAYHHLEGRIVPSIVFHREAFELPVRAGG